MGAVCSGKTATIVDEPKPKSEYKQQPEIKSKITEDKVDQELINRILKRIPLLSRLKANERKQLASSLSPHFFKPGETVFKQGDEKNSEFYLIMEGRAEGTISDDNNNVVNTFQMEEGDFFGERALLTEEPRAATITALSKLHCQKLHRNTFLGLFSKSFFPKRNAISSETSSVQRARMIQQHAMNSTDEQSLSSSHHRKDEKIINLIKQAINKKKVLSASLDPEQLSLLIDNMKKERIIVNKQIGIEPLIKQGEPGDNYYIIEDGSFNVYIQTTSEDNKEIKESELKGLFSSYDQQRHQHSHYVATVSSGQSFGELALMYNCPRNATVMPNENSVVWSIDRYTFKRILHKISSEKVEQIGHFLMKVHIGELYPFGSLTKQERIRIGEALEECSFPSNYDIIKENEPGDSFFIIRNGEVQVLKTDTTLGKQVENRRLSIGDYFGERSLLLDEPRAATIRTVSNVKCYKMDRQSFQVLLGPLEDVLRRSQSEYEEKDRIEEKLESEIDNTMQKFNKIGGATLDSLVTLGILGRGSFGYVTLVQAPNGNSYALKAISKEEITHAGQQEHIISEKDAMIRLHNNNSDQPNPCMTHLYATYQDKNCIYFLNEVCLGGELFSYLRTKTYLDEDSARFYAGCVILAFEYMHSRDIIYRDLKPENLLIDEKGYLKVTDFGFAKYCTGRTYTLCGTPDYLAPEVITGQGHGKSVDWWTLGILIYEMLAGVPPFFEEEQIKTYARIVSGRLSYPKRLSTESVDLIRRLLHMKPHRRLGVMKNGVKMIKEHKWFTNAYFNWNALANRTLKAPFIPTIKYKNDTSNFDCKEKCFFPSFYGDDNIFVDF